jgi:hypothetical protein
VDRQLNLSHGALAAVHLWFTLRGRWAPPSSGGLARSSASTSGRIPGRCSRGRS